MKKPSRLNELKDDLRACQNAFLNKPTDHNRAALIAAVEGYREDWEKAKIAALLEEEVDDEPETPILKAVGE